MTESFFPFSSAFFRNNNGLLKGTSHLNTVYKIAFHLTIVKTFDSLFTDLLVKLNQDIQAFHGEVDTASRTQLNRNALLELCADIQDDYRQLYSGYKRVRDSQLKVADIRSKQPVRISGQPVIISASSLMILKALIGTNSTASWSGC
ncbi:hypothetical protein [Amphibacillus cookii]|uniref:hypothetical protein n=1 Tax=Amphibacillus cookii TaxID=767787 RepID=UPI0019568499|nr:hypothetical protein [Amphibacillus cookii]